MARVRYLNAGVPTTTPGDAGYASTSGSMGGTMISANVSAGGDLGVRATGFLVLAILGLIILTEMNNR